MGTALSLHIKVKTDEGITFKKVQIDLKTQQVFLQAFNLNFPQLIIA